MTRALASVASLATLLLLIVPLACANAAQEVKPLFDFEDNDVAKFEPGAGAQPFTISDQHATHGTHSIRVPCENAGYLVRFANADWSGYDELQIDAFVEGDQNVKGLVLVGDEAWSAKARTYWNRHNGFFTLKPGVNLITVAVGGLFRGEAGSKGNDIKEPIDPAKILRFDLGFTYPEGTKGAVFLDNFRLVRDTKPAGLYAFDFGPEGQSVFPGFTGITWNTVHGGNGGAAGLHHPLCNPNRSRDDSFPTRLFGDLIELEDNLFIVDLPNGKYGAWMVFDDPGYWGWEIARFAKRVVKINGVVASTEDRGPSGPTDALFHFEAIEPNPSTDIYETYIKVMYPQRRFEFEVSNGRMEMAIETDNRWSTKVAAMVVYPKAKEGDANAWISDVEARNRDEFLKRAVCVDKPKPEPKAPADAAAKGYWLGYPTLDQNPTFGDAPGADGKLARTGARGERLSFTFALRPQQDLGEVSVTLTDLTGPGGTIPSARIDARYVHHALKRGFSDIAYAIAPETVRTIPGSGLKLTKGMTRQFWITVAIPDAAKPGAYAGKITVHAGTKTVDLPIAVEVADVTLDQPDFVDNYLGFGVPESYDAAKAKAARDELFAFVRDGGMNSVTDGPGIHFDGFAADGAPKLDFAACDEFFTAAKASGLAMKEVNVYGSLAMVDGIAFGYELGDEQRDLAAKYGKPYGEILKSVWGAVQKHAEAAKWPIISYCRCDEPRVLENAQRVVAMMKLCREHAPWLRIGGYYSVGWDHDDPLSAAIQDIFKTLVWSGLNEHHQIDVDKAKELGRELYIYNQGNGRYSFGAYQWAEMRKGVKGRSEWHLSAVSGYQFFDLDGREPDIGYVRWGSKGIIPSIDYHRTREGVDDFKWAVTLWNAAGRAGAKGEDAKKWLQGIADAIPAGEHEPAKTWMGDDAFRAECIKRLRGLK